MIEQLAGAIGAIFTPSSGARLLHLVVPAHVHGHTLALVRALGEAAAAPRPVWVLADPFHGPSRGWTARARSLDLERAGDASPLDRERAGSAPRPDTAWTPVETAAEPLAAFARSLQDHLAALADAADIGAVVVLAPQHIADAAAYARDVEALAGDPTLATARWIIIDPAQSSLGALVERLGASASRVVLPEVDGPAWSALEELLTDLAAQGVGLPPDLDARIAADSPLRAADQRAIAARRLLHEADKCSSVGRHADAARLEAQAESVLSAQSLVEEAVHVAMARARSLVASGAADEGHRVFIAALKDAERRGMQEIVPEAYASLGSLHSKHRRFLDAHESYARAGELAQRRGSPEFAADMHRCSGHAALNADMPDRAAQAWARAFDLLGAPAPTVGALDKPRQIVVLGLALADAFEAHGNLPAARGLRGHAEAIEQRNPRPAGSWS